MMKKKIIQIFWIVLLASCTNKPVYEMILRNGMVYDGSGGQPFQADIAVNQDTIAAIGDLRKARGNIDLDIQGLSVAPGFINMLSWANESLIEDGRSQSDIRQGVTLEVLGEGLSMGPLNDAMKDELREEQQDIIYDIEWTTLGNILISLRRKAFRPMWLHLWATELYGNM